MRNIANWFAGRGEDERQRTQIIEDSNKSLKKRFTTLQQILKGFEKTREVRYEDTFSPKQNEFYQTHASEITAICTEYLRHLDLIKGRSRMWEDVFSCLDILIEMAKYGHYTISYAFASEFTKDCLLEENRNELRDRGLRLLLSLINQAPQDPQLRSFLLAAIDLKPFVIDTSSIHLPDTSILLSRARMPFTSATNEALIKLRPISQPYVIPELKEFADSSFTASQQNTLHFFSLALSYAEKSDFPPDDPLKRSDHFARWFNTILHPIFYLLYPAITPQYTAAQQDSVRALREANMGFHSECALSLHYVIINWLIRCIHDDDLRVLLLKDKHNYDFVMDIIGHTFLFKEVYSSMQSSVVDKVLALYSEWLESRFIVGSYAFSNLPKHVKTILNSSIQLCSAVKAPKSEWLQVISLFDNYHKFLQKSRQASTVELRQIFVESTLMIARKLQEFPPTAKNIQEVIEPSVALILSLLNDFQLFEVPWAYFSPLLNPWAQKSEKIVQNWFEMMEKLTDEYKAQGYSASSFSEGWLEMFGVLGNPLSMTNQVQLSWTACVRRLIQKVINPQRQAPTCNFLGKIFFVVLSSMVWRAESSDTRQIAMEALLDILVEARGQELPEHSYLHHFSSLVCLRGEDPMLTPTILMRLPSLLEHSSMHIHIMKLVNLAMEMPTFSLRLVYALLSFPNHYGEATLLSYTNATNYQSLKRPLRQLLLKCCNTTETSGSAVYGLTVFIIEELLCGQENVSSLIIEDLTSFVLHPNEIVARTALHCLAVLAPSTSDLASSIVSFLLSSLRKQPSEDLSFMMLRTLQHLLINNPQLAMEHDLVKQIYASLHSLQARSVKLSEELEVMVSFLMHYFSNFPLKNCPPSVMCSTISNSAFAGLDDFLCDTGPCEAEQMHFVLNKDTLLTVFIIESRCRLLIRNAFGRFAWNADNFRLFSSPNEHDDKGSYAECEDFFKSATVELTRGAETEELIQQTVLEDLVAYVLYHYPECKLFETNDSIPKDRNFTNFDALEKSAEIWPKLTASQPAKLNLARALMSHLGLLDEAELLESGEQLNRAISELDKMQCREIVKLGVIYVGQGQYEQKEILANSSSSPEFIEFIQSLGSIVDVKTHEGYLGGIDKEGSVGKQTISYADWQHDVVYHVIPMMPTDPEDDQQINKKRHVGNDCVHIVWSEHWRDYEKDTITSHFNFTHIVIYPLSNGLYRVQIHMKHPSLIGPLQDGMVVSKPLLVPLVVETAIQANNTVRQKHFERYKPMLTARIEKIKDIKTRYSNQSTVREEMLVALS